MPQNESPAGALSMSRRIRRTPYTGRVESAGVRAFTVTNHMLLPKAYRRSVEDDYRHLREAVQMWDVSCQRQVQIEGPDAARLVQMMTPRNIGGARPGDCLYLPLVAPDGGIVNDPVMLKLAEDRYWLSIADSDVLLYALGLATGAGFEVEVSEPDVSPLAVQGPRAEDVMARLFGEEIRRIGFFRFGRFEFGGIEQVVARSGYSGQDGFEIYLRDAALGASLWNAVREAGRDFGIAPGCPNLIDRIEAGLLSYGNDMTRDDNPLELGMAKLCTLDGSIDFVGRAALVRIAETGVARIIRGVAFGGGPGPVCATPWSVTAGSRIVGGITSAAWSPRLEHNVGLSLIDREFWNPGQPVMVETPDGEVRPGEVSALPFD